ncbi:hypothetical protein H0H92_004629 [Tricholoma furcatifolium]|nr:hypothetical protein H0H92_004629 [Tricholoma furcatifolium]
MKLFAPLSALAMAAMALAQAPAPGDTQILHPTNGSRVERGSKVVVQFQRAFYGPTPSTEVGIAIGIQPCGAQACPSPKATFGPILYTGPFNPVQYPSPTGPKVYENFTITIPDFSPGKVQINIGRFYFMGPGPTPLLDFYSTNVFIY